MIALRLNASDCRSDECISRGKRSSSRPIVEGAVPAWIVPNTRCPVSAACMAALKVSRSRISPTRMTSGSCRTACFSATSQSITSMPTSRWLMMHLSSLNVYSIGSSMVTMCSRSRSFMYWSIEAIVVLLPDPVTPGQDDDSLVVLGDLGQDRREVEIFEAGDLVVHPPRHQAEPAALLEQVDAKPGLELAVEDDVGEVDAPFLVEDAPLAGREQRDTSAVPCRRW